MNLIFKILGLFFLPMVMIISCKDKRKPNIQYMPDMYESVGYETYSDNVLSPNGEGALIPPEGTIARGHSLYPLPNSEEGYIESKNIIKSPLEVNKKNLLAGKELYNVYCSLCHGDKGDGQGELVKNEKILGVPVYKDRELNEGNIYHVIYYGRNMMGAHAGQLNEKERWQVVQYVQMLRGDISEDLIK